MATSSSFTVYALPAAPGNPTSNSPQCIGFGVTLTRTGTPPGGETWYWQTSAGGTSTSNSGITYNVASSGTYYIRSQNNTSLCWSNSSGNTTVAVNPAPTIIGSSGSRCGPGTIDLGANASSGTIYWYDQFGIPLATGSAYKTLSLSSSATYYVEASNGGCTSSPRTAVVAAIIDPATISVEGAGSYCTGSIITLKGIGANLASQYWNGPNGFYSSDPNPVINNVTSTNAGTYTVTGSALSGINLIANGDFELGNIGFNSSYTYVAPSAAALQPEGVYTIVADPKSVHGSFWPCGDHTPSGTLMMVVNGAAASQNIWTQTVNVIPNTDYQFTYWIQSVHPTSPSKSQLYVNDVEIGAPYTAGSTYCTWEKFLFNWSSGSSTSAILELRNQNLAADGNDFALDDIVFQQACPSVASGVVTVNAVPGAGTIGNVPAICRGYTPAAITSTTDGTGTGTISYEWQTNASGSYITIPGATAATHTPPALAATTSYQRRTVAVSGGATCYSIYTTPVIITVTGPMVNAGGSDLACQSATPAAITLSGASFGGGATTAAWSIISGGGSLSSLLQTANPQNVTYTPNVNYSGSVTLRLTTNNIGAPSNCDAIAERTITVRPIPTASISGTITVCQNATAPNITFTNPQTFPVTITYNINSGTNTTVNVGASTTAILAAPTSASGTFIYNLVSVAYQSAPTCSNTISGTATVTVTPNSAVGVSIVPSANPVCIGTLVTYTATASNGGTTPVYQWKVNGVNAGIDSNTYSYIPGTEDAITCVLTSNLATCISGNPATSNTINMTFSAAPVSGTLTPTPAAGAVCDGAFVSATATSGTDGSGTITDFVEYRYDGGSGSWTTYSSGSPLTTSGHSLVEIRTYRTATGSGCTNSAPVVVSWNVNAVPVSGTLISNPAVGAVCTGTTISATPTAGTGGAGTIADVLQYRVDGGSWVLYTSGLSVSTFTHSSVDIRTYRTATGSGCTSSTPVVASWTVNSTLTASISIAASPSGAICTGTSVTFTATPVNGGTTPVYLWKKNGTPVGTNSPIYTDASLANNDQITCELTSNATCATSSPSTSNTVTMSVNPVLPVSVSIAASPSGTICTGTSVTFTATPVNGGTTPVYQWKKNGTNIGTNSASYTDASLANNDQITCELTSNATCSTGSPFTSNAVTMSVDPVLPVSVSIAASPSGTTCAGTSVTFTATPVNGGTIPVYQWKKNGTNIGTNSASYTDAALANNDQITCELTSNATCATGSPFTSNAVTMSVNPALPVSVSIAASPSGTICAGTSVTFTATSVNGGTTPVYQWKKNGTNIGTNSASYTDASWANNDQISCELTSNATCATGSPATSNTVTMSVNPLPVAVITNNTGSTVLSCATIAISVTATGGVSYSWFDGANEVGISVNLSIITPGTYTVTATAANGCIDTEVVTITQNITAPTEASIGSVTTVLNSTTTTIKLIASASDNSSSSNLTYLWSTGATTVTIDVTTAATYTVTITDPDNGCTTTTSRIITQDAGLPVIPTVFSITTKDNTPLISGTATVASGETLKVIVNGMTYTVGDGKLTLIGTNWSLQIPSGSEILDGTYSVSATVTNTGGFSSTDTSDNELIIDTKAPATPIVVSQTTNDTTPLISGTATVAMGKTLSVTVNGITYIAGDGKLTLIGANWSLQIPAGSEILDGTYAVTAKVTDAAGNSSIDTTGSELTIDTIAPVIPTVTSQTTNDTTPLISGTATVAIGETLNVTINGITYTVGDGHLTLTGSNWNLQIPDGSEIINGTYSVTAKVTDAAGNISTDVTGGELIIDTIAPAIPTVVSQTTNDNTPLISGTATVALGETLKVTVNGISYTVGDGKLTLIGTNWSLQIPSGSEILDGIYPVTAVVTDAAGNSSTDQTTDELTIDTVIPPVARIQGPSIIAVGNCNVEGKILDGSKSSGDRLTYSWTPSDYLDNPASSKPLFHPGKSTRYTLTVTNFKGVKDTVSVMVLVAVAPKAVTDKNVFVDAPTATILLNGAKSTGSGLAYLWLSKDGNILNGNTKATSTVRGLGMYYLQVTDSLGCSDRDSVSVGLYIQAINDTAQTKVNESVIINVLRNDIPQGPIDPSSISIVTPPLHGFAEIVADSMILYTPEQYYAGQDDFVYSICDQFRNCDNAKVVLIINDIPLFIPEAFSPNGDGINDKFQIKGLAKYKTVEIEIFNRWGNIVYRSNNYGDGIGKSGFWDGTDSSGMRVGIGPVPSGTYYYVLTLNGNEKLSKSVYLDR